jgi:hypothetical protein
MNNAAPVVSGEQDPAKHEAILADMASMLARVWLTLLEMSALDPHPRVAWAAQMAVQFFSNLVYIEEQEAIYAKLHEVRHGWI